MGCDAERESSLDLSTMAHDDTVPSRGSDGRLGNIRSAREQVEAALLRRQLLGAVGSGELPGRDVPGYTIEREIHRGGQGTVFLAVQVSTGRRVAIKILNRMSSARSRAAGFARFEREVEALSVLKHANVVTIHDCGRDRDHVYLVMDYVDGKPLDEYLHDRPIEEVLGLFARVCDGVNAAHLRGVIHRDLKPANILVDERGEPRVLDFGLAKLAGDPSAAGPPERAMTATGEFVGSLPWASPEQAEGRTDDLDIRTDVYSLGVVLYQVLTGQFPYPVTGRISDVVRHIAQTDPARPSTINRKVDRELEIILLKCLAKEPERRYQSAGDLARDIRRLLAGQPIEARRDSLAYVMTKQLTRYRAVAAGAGVILLVVVIALVVSLSLWRKAARQGVIALQSAAEATESAKRADEEADQARAVVEFMRGVLTSVEPERRGADVRLIQVLSEASASASQRLGGHPLQEAEVRDLLGQIYYKLSMWPESRAQFARASELWSSGAGPDDRRTLASRLDLMRTFLNLAQTWDAEALLKDLTPRLERVVGAEHPLSLEAQRGVAMTLLLHGHGEEAERILLGLRGHPNLAGDDVAQVRILGSLIAVYTSRLNTEDDARRQATLSLAEPLALEWIERSTRVSGAQSVSTLQALVKWADITSGLGRFEEAAAACRRILDGSAERLGECHTIRTSAMYILAEASAKLGEVQEPADLFLRAIECSRAQNDPRSPLFLGVLNDALKYLDRAERAEDGERVARELASRLREIGAEHGDIAHMAEMYVAAFVSMRGGFAEAETLFAALLERVGKIPDERVRARLYALYANHLTRRGEYARAEESLGRAAAELGDIRRGTWDPYPDDVIVTYIALYKAWGKPERIAEYEMLRSQTRPR
jgi:tetratricopeptide (TPR) repeat protein